MRDMDTVSRTAQEHPNSGNELIVLEEYSASHIHSIAQIRKHMKHYGELLTTVKKRKLRWYSQ